MAKKNIDKVLTSGSPKQRLLLIAEERARGKYFKERLLTEGEFNKLNESFRKPNEVKLWNEFRNLDDTITNAIINLQGKMFEVLMNYSNLRGYILVWNTIENAELLVNSVLHEIKNQEERRRIAKAGATDVNILLVKTEPDQEGYIDINIDPKEEKISLQYAMNNVKKEVETSVIQYLSWERATLDFMEERGFNVKTYKEQIKIMTAKIYEPIIGWDKYSGEISSPLSHPRLERIVKKYAICPNMDDLKVDEEEYNWFRRYFLDGEDYPEELRGKVNKSLSYE
jgi:hypothetical protein